jgi:hypothetical protein
MSTYSVLVAQHPSPENEGFGDGVTLASLLWEDEYHRIPLW